MRISSEEKDQWHKDVRVRFQPKAWFDDSLCEDYALEEVREITSEARRAGRESVAIFDNLSGQTTKQHLLNLMQNKCKRHLLPGGMTDELQLVDDGVGYALKNEMGKLHDEWLMEDGNLELWTAEGKTFGMWKKRVLITQLTAKAWENVCSRFDFESAARRLGMRMTVDGFDDQFIRIQGVDAYSFCDADGGPPGEESSDEGADPDEELEVNADVQHHQQVDDSGRSAGDYDDDGLGDGEHALECDDDEFVDEIDSSDDEDDDTAGTAAYVIGSAQAPTGYRILDEIPSINTATDLQQLIGRTILYGWDSKHATGWFIGTVHSTNVTASDRKKTPSANAVVSYKSKLTNKALNGNVACELSMRTYGRGEWWVLVAKE